jgi:glucose-6-phosphate 1-epimerase
MHSQSMQNLEELNEHFAIPGALVFAKGNGGLVTAQVSTSTCTAELYLHGAHLTAWQPIGHAPAIFLSEQSNFSADKPIRGGVPIIFPWFGARTATPDNPRTDGPSHGFARTSLCRVAFAARAGDDLHLTLTLTPDETSRALGFDQFQLAYELVLGSELRMRLTVANTAESPLHFEEALHTYLAVGDAAQVQIHGLANTEFLDKTDGFQRKRQVEEALMFTGETDRPYLNTAATVTLDDPVLRRRITVAKTNSLTTVLWNPWAELSAKLPDLGPDSWRKMTCIETANAAENSITLAPRAGGTPSESSVLAGVQAHTMEAHLRVEELPR